MTIGFVLIETVTKNERKAYKALEKIPEIVELHPIFGEYDLIAKIEADDYNHLGLIIVDKIRILKSYIVDTKTLTGISF